MFKIFVIDSNEKYLEEIDELLSGCNYRVYKENDFIKAKESIHTFIPELILCEQEVNGINVIDFLDYKKNYRELAQIPLIVISINSQESAIRKSMNHGADDYLVKPVVQSDLLLSISARLKKYIKIKQIQIDQEQNLF